MIWLEKLYIGNKTGLFTINRLWDLLQSLVLKPDCWYYGLTVSACRSPSFHLSSFDRHTPLSLSAFFSAYVALWLSSPMWIIALSWLSWSYTNNICQLIYHCSPRLSTLVYSSMPCFCIPASRVKMHVTSATENNPSTPPKSLLIFAQICKCRHQ